MRITLPFGGVVQFVKGKRGETGHCICGARDRCDNWTACALVVIAISRAPKDICRVHKRQQMVSSGSEVGTRCDWNSKNRSYESPLEFEELQNAKLESDGLGLTSSTVFLQKNDSVGYHRLQQQLHQKCALVEEESMTEIDCFWLPE
jgi:hypothetical protein